MVVTMKMGKTMTMTLLNRCPKERQGKCLMMRCFFLLLQFVSDLKQFLLAAQGCRWSSFIVRQWWWHWNCHYQVLEASQPSTSESEGMFDYQGDSGEEDVDNDLPQQVFMPSWGSNQLKSSQVSIVYIFTNSFPLAPPQLEVWCRIECWGEVSP